MSTYLLLSTITFLLLGLMWRADHLLNMLIKAYLFILFLSGGFLFLLQNGYVIKN